jgi:predicted enzyme related to lactoylglutathione lyase
MSMIDAGFLDRRPTGFRRAAAAGGSGGRQRRARRNLGDTFPASLFGRNVLGSGGYAAWRCAVGNEWENVVIDAEDPARLARWWAEALSYQIIDESPDEVEIRRDPDRAPGLIFVPVPEAKKGKNRLHIDLRPDDQDAEVERLVDMGARHVDVGQSRDVTWVVLADPEGNEFCVLRARR